jgi:hypothetical protein
MRIHEWEATIQEIVNECNHRERRSDHVVMGWRAKLEKEPTLLSPHQIDEIAREVRRRLNKVNQ